MGTGLNTVGMCVELVFALHYIKENAVSLMQELLLPALWWESIPPRRQMPCSYPRSYGDCRSPPTIICPGFRFPLASNKPLAMKGQPPRASYPNSIAMSALQ